MLIVRIHDDLKKAQFNRDEAKLSTLRMLLSEITYAKIAKGQELGDADIVSVVQKEIKKRKEAAQAFRQGKREDAAVKEESEAVVLSGYLPVQLTDEELYALVEETIKVTGASIPADFGKVMGAVMGKVGQKADSQRVNMIIKSKLGV